MSPTQEILKLKIETDENQQQIRKMVMNSYKDIASGKGRDCNEFFDKLEKGIHMHKYKIVLLSLAEEDIIDQTDYIKFVLKSRETALKMVAGFRKAINDFARKNNEKYTF